MEQKGIGTRQGLKSLFVLADVKLAFLRLDLLVFLRFAVERGGQDQTCGNLKCTEQMDFRGRTYRAVATRHCPVGCHFFLSKEQSRCSSNRSLVSRR